MKKQSIVGRTAADRRFDAINTVLCILLMIIFLYPLYFVVIASFSDPMLIWNGEVTLIPKGVHMEGYRAALNNESLVRGYANSIYYTVLATSFSMVLTVCAAYPLSHPKFMVRSFFMKMFTFTMYFSGGLIPTYLLVKNLGLVNTVGSVVLTAALNMTNMIIMRSFFQSSIPNELRESVEIDGGSDFRYLISMVLPLSKSVLAVIALYYAVANWNTYYRAMIYLFDNELYPLQLVLREILFSANSLLERTDDFDDISKLLKEAESVKYSIIVLASIPPMVLYPFVQKYFVKGVMIGSIKG